MNLEDLEKSDKDMAIRATSAMNIEEFNTHRYIQELKANLVWLESK